MDNIRVNMFIKPIFDKKRKHDLFSYLKLRSLIRKLNKTSPSFNMMIEIYEFIKLLETIYMYGNDDSHFLFSATVPNGYDASMIYKEDNFSITFLLRKSDHHIAIKTNRSGRSKSYDRIIEFNEGDNVIHNIYDEQSFLFIISCLMNGAIELITYYYKNKKI